MMKRFSDWEVRLSQYLMERKEMPFEYGVNDCCCFAAGAVMAITGEDLMADITAYDSLKTSLKAIKDAGAADISEVIDGKLPEIPVGFASTGDLCFYDGSVGVVIGGRAAFVSEDEFALIDRAQWTKAWGVARG